MVQYRDKKNSDKVFTEKAKRILDVTKRYGVPLIINDRATIAREIGASGVHIGQDDIGVYLYTYPK